MLDLDATETLDSDGLTALLERPGPAPRTGRRLKLATTNANNRKILEITRLDQHLEVFEASSTP